MALSELHLALIGAGAAGVLMVWGYNVWQDRQHRKTAERIFNGGAEDSTGNGAAEAAPAPVNSRQEPTLHADVEPEAHADDLQPAESPDLPDATGAVLESADISDAPGDAVADCTLCLRAAEAVAVPIVMSIQRSWAGELSKPLTWRARDDAGKAWRVMSSETTGAYRHWAVSLPVADRRGAVGEAELAAFVEAVRGLARQVGATVDGDPDPAETAANAAALDQFCASVDIQFALHVVDAGGGTFPGTKLRGLAEAAGMVLEPDGVFRARDEAGGEEYSLGNISQATFDAEGLRNLTIHGVTFSIDVPRVAMGPAAFERMLTAARQLASAMGGVLVDAQRAPLADPMIAAIRDKIVELQQRMRDGGIDPGSQRALRLFS